jgi:hypothetical protein
MLLMALKLYSQDSCRVLVPALQGDYKGACKHGLAHGEGIAMGDDIYRGSFRKGYPDGYGTYYWSNGATYQGQWRKGKRNGKGSYSFKIDGRDSSLVGIWKNDIYMGVEHKNPEVNRSYNIDSYSFNLTGGIQNRVLISFKQNGSQNTRVDNLLLNASSGTLSQTGQLRGFDNVEFPVTISVRYDTYNKMGTQIINAYIEFVIYEKGDWKVRLKN